MDTKLFKILGLLTVLMISTQVFSQTVIFNSTFDNWQDGFPVGWNKELSTIHSATHVTGKNNSLACQIITDSAHQYLVSDYIHFDTSKIYNISFWAKPSQRNAETITRNYSSITYPGLTLSLIKNDTFDYTSFFTDVGIRSNESEGFYYVTNYNAIRNIDSARLFLIYSYHHDTITIDNLVISEQEVKQAYPDYMSDDYYTSYYIYSDSNNVYHIFPDSSNITAYTNQVNLADIYDNPDSLDINNISALINSNGLLSCSYKIHYDTIYRGKSLYNNDTVKIYEVTCSNINGPFIPSSHFKVPKNGVYSGDSLTFPQSIFAANIWMSGLDDDSILHVAASKYQSEGLDYFYGPISNNFTDSNYINKYNKLWKITRQQIINHINNYSNENYQMPEVIKSWPANGDENSGEAHNLAPYFDVNNNDIYEPAQGDYPLIRGDEAVYFIFNDNSYKHTESEAFAELGFEVHGMAYAFDTTDDALNNTIFITYKIINRSNNNYHDLHISQWVDFDLGYGFDDRVGFDRQLDMFYVYNGDSVDGPGLLATYPLNPPAQGAMLLNRQASGFLYYNNSAAGNGVPEWYRDYYNYQRNRWRDGQTMRYGGNGYSDVLIRDSLVNFMLDGDPVTQTGWTEVSAGYTPGDRRGVTNCFIGDVAPGEEFCFDVAYPFAWDYFGSAPTTSLTLLRQNASKVRTFFLSKYSQCNVFDEFPEVIVSDNNIEANNIVTLYPNPTNKEVRLTLNNLSKATITITDLQGKIVKTINVAKQTTEVTIDVSGFVAGTYTITIQTDEKCINKKLIVQ